VDTRKSSAKTLLDSIDTAYKLGVILIPKLYKLFIRICKCRVKSNEKYHGILNKHYPRRFSARIGPIIKQVKSVTNIFSEQKDATAV
jgi:hypothetical protein